MAFGYTGSVTEATANFMLDYALVLRALSLFFIPWICWRVWSFTIIPFIRPHEPKELPYAVPFLAHGIGFFKNQPKVLRRADKYFAAEKAPYSLSLFGESIYVVSNPEHTVEVYKNTKNLTFEEFVVELLGQTGISKDALEKVSKPLPRDKAGFPNPGGDPFTVLVRSIHMHQAYPGDNLKVLDSHFVDWFEEHLSMPGLGDLCSPFAHNCNEKAIEVPLWEFCSQIQVQASGDSYFGPCLRKVFPQFATNFLEFDDLCWQLLYQYPSFLTGELRGKMTAMAKALESYYQIPREERTGSLWQIRQLEDELRAIKISEEDMGKIMFNVFWGINTNARKTAFWILSHILQEPSLIDAIRKETDPAFDGDHLTDTEYLFEQCPQLTDVWHETLRMYSHAVSARAIKEDTVIGGKLLRKGRRVMIPARMLHFNESVFGEDVHVFRPSRFAQKTADLTKSASWRPFGGGKSLCSGRHVARHKIFIFTAVILRRFDITKVDPSVPFPEGDEGKPVLGMMSMRDGHEYVVRLTQRE